MPDDMDVQRLMAEVKKRPTLWDVRYSEYKDRTNTPHLWQEIADILGTDVEHCKRKWKNLRDAYRAEVRRTERRLERQRAGLYDPKANVASKWVYFEPMSFINESKRARHTTPTSSTSAAAAEGATGTVAKAEENASPNDSKFESYCDVKMEPRHTTDEDDDDENDLLFEEFKSVATPQAARRLSSSLAHAAEEDIATVATPAAAAGNGHVPEAGCKCTKRADDQVQFLETLEREEQKLMQSTRQDISRSNNLAHVGDSDYNFLVSFLPQMKKMCELQNLQFRAKMSELLLNIMSPPGTVPTCTAAPPAHTAHPIPLPAVSHVQQQPQQPQQQRPCLQNYPSQSTMAISTTTPMQGTSGMLSSGDTPQQQLQILQSELLNVANIDNNSGGSIVATSSSSWP